LCPKTLFINTLKSFRCSGSSCKGGDTTPETQLALEDEMTTLSQTQLATLNAITNNNTANFWEGYTYVKSIVSNSGGASDLLFWLDQAAQINADQYESQGNFFIRDVTRAGL
jgi:hypothetical protein